MDNWETDTVCPEFCDSDTSLAPSCVSTRTREKRRVMRNDESIRCCVGCDYVYMLADLAVVSHVRRWALLFPRPPVADDPARPQPSNDKLFPGPVFRRLSASEHA